MDVKRHWEQVYAKKDPRCVSWYEPRPEISLTLIGKAGLPRGAPIIDVGAGASTLVDELLHEGYTDITVLDISARAIEVARRRLGLDADRIKWICADLQSFRPHTAWRLWHDRALLHFLVTPDDQTRYVQTMRESLVPGGEAVLSTFGTDGPDRCSGLPVQRYSPESLSELLGEGFTLLDRVPIEHRTPSGAVQKFLCARFRRD